MMTPEELKAFRINNLAEGRKKKKQLSNQPVSQPSGQSAIQPAEEPQEQLPSPIKVEPQPEQQEHLHSPKTDPSTKQPEQSATRQSKDTSAIVELVREIKNIATGKTSPMTTSDIPMDDVLEEEVVFWTWGREHTIFSEKRKGHDIVPPYGKPIKFNHEWTNTRGSGKNKQLNLVCKFRTTSKKMVEFIRTSAEFGTRIFESSKAVDGIDMAFHSTMNDIAAQVNKLDYHQIMLQAQQLGLPIEENLENLKRRLIDYRTTEAIRANKESQIRSAARSDMTPEEKIKRGGGVKMIPEGQETVPANRY